jgi:hypothetical protein
MKAEKKCVSVCVRERGREREREKEVKKGKNSLRQLHLNTVKKSF